MSNLPKGWMDASLGEITDPFISIDPRKTPNEIFRYIDIGSIDNKTQTIREPKEFQGRDAPSRARRLVQTGDVLFSTVRTYLKNVAQVPDNLDGALTSTGISVLRPSDGIDERYLFRWVCSDNFINEISKTQDGTMYPAVSDKDVAAGNIPIPPSLEQRRIAVKLDSLFARTRRAREELDRIPLLIEHYRQSVLFAAFSGSLTADWRVEKRASTWESVRVGDVVSAIRAGKNLKCEERPPKASENGVVKVSAVTWGKFDPLQSKTLPPTFKPPPDTKINNGDFLFSRANTLELVGACVIVQGAPDNLFLSDKILRLEIDDNLKGWLLWFLRSPQGRQSLENVASGNQHSMRNIGQKSLLGIEMPLPSPQERKVIVQRVEGALSKIDGLAAEHEKVKRLLGHFDQAILAKAFRGDLVPQDPNDEPASVLLDRIHSEREQASLKKRTSLKGRQAKQGRKTTRRRRQDMGKKRAEVERDHLGKTLSELGGSANAKELWQKSDMDIDEFYKQLRDEVKAGRIREGSSKDEMVLADAA